MVEETIKPAKRTLAQIAADMTAKKGLKDSEFPVQEQPKPENLTYSHTGNVGLPILYLSPKFFTKIPIKLE